MSVQISPDIKLRIEIGLMIKIIRPASVHFLPVAACGHIGCFGNMPRILYVIAVKSAKGFVSQIISELRAFFKSSFFDVTLIKVASN